MKHLKMKASWFLILEEKTAYFFPRIAEAKHLMELPSPALTHLAEQINHKSWVKQRKKIKKKTKTVNISSQKIVSFL